LLVDRTGSVEKNRRIGIEMAALPPFLSQSSLPKMSCRLVERSGAETSLANYQQHKNYSFFLVIRFF
ncbi:MAG: hypothetical protein LBU22_07785, partial [Dysgonamonadaceae bacterium]|nr:hypothetical protein [Dysgonamonadaceae bacterium]